MKGRLGDSESHPAACRSCNQDNQVLSCEGRMTSVPCPHQLLHAFRDAPMRARAGVKGTLGGLGESSCNMQITWNIQL